MSLELSGLEVVAEVVRRHYDVGDVKLPAPLPGAHQRRHRKMIVETQRGKYMAKTYSRDSVVLDSLRFQHNLSSHLDRNRVPVATILAARNGKRIVELDTWAMEMQDFIEGASMPVNATTLATSGQALGRFHMVCKGVPVPPRDARLWRFSEVPRKKFEQLYDLARQERPGEEATHHCNRIALFLHQAASELSIEKRANFETGLIHGDWHSGNLLFVGNDLRAVVDLEFAGDGCYLEDLSYAVSNLCVRTTINHDKLLWRTNMLLDNYQLSRSLSYDEHIALYFAVGVKHVTTVAYQIRGLDERLAGYSPAQWLERLSIQCDWLMEQARKARWGE